MPMLVQPGLGPPSPWVGEATGGASLCVRGRAREGGAAWAQLQEGGCSALGLLMCQGA